MLALVLIAAACGSPGEDREEVRGVVLEVDGDLTSVESFVLRTDEGEILRVVPAPEGDFRFPLPHLRDHLRTAEPLLVELDRSYDPPRATAIRDADNPDWHGAVGTGPGPEDSQAPAEATGAEPGDEPGEPPVDTAATTSTVPAPEGTVEEQPGEVGDVAEETIPEETVVEETVVEETPDAPEQDGEAPEGTEDGPDGEQVEDEEGPIIDLVIVDGKLDGGARRESAAVGDTVTIRVSGNSNDEVHVHGYDLFVDLVDGAGQLTFEASIPGVFEIELEGSHTLLVRLEVS